MSRQHDVATFLDELFPNPRAPLAFSDPFLLSIAVILSAQCTDERVLMVMPQLQARASSPETMQHVPVQEVEQIIRPCGLYRRKAAAIVQLSRILVEQYHGVVPCDFHALEQLPGIGHKTASVIMAQAFFIPAFPVDTHVFRLAHRWGLSSCATEQGVEQDLKRCFAPHEWLKRHLQMIFYGRAFCPARGHLIARCPICSFIQRTAAAASEQHDIVP